MLFSRENDEFKAPVCLCNVLIDLLPLHGILIIRQFLKIPCHIAMDKDM